MSTDWIEAYIHWGLTRSEKPWLDATATAYRRELRRLERISGKPAEELDAEDLRGYQADHRSDIASTWNGRYFAIFGFYEFLEDEGFYQQLDAQGRRRSNPSKAIKRRKLEPKAPAPDVDVLAAIADMADSKDRLIALFLYHSGLKLSEVQSIKEPPREGKVHVRRHRGKWEWVAVRPYALEVLEQLGGRVPHDGYLTRTLQRRFPLKPSEFTKAGRRDFQLGGVNEDALAPARALLVGRPDLLDVARAYRDGVEALEGPKPKPETAITAAARSLQEMLLSMGAKGNSLAPLFDNARSRGLFRPHDAKLADALDRLVDWVNADRSERGDAHKETDAQVEDAEMTLRIVAAVLVRLEALRPPK